MPNFLRIYYLKTGIEVSFCIFLSLFFFALLTVFINFLKITAVTGIYTHRGTKARAVNLPMQGFVDFLKK